MPKINTIKDETIKLLNEGKLSFDEIAELLNTSKSYILQIRRDFVTDEPIKIKRRSKKRDAIVEMLNKGMSVEEIASKGYNKNTIREYKNKYTNIKFNKGSNNKLSNDIINKIVSLHKEGKTINEICDIIGVSSTSVRKYIKLKGYNTSSKIKTEDIINKISSGKSFKEIANEYNCDIHSIYYYSSRYFTADERDKLKKERNKNFIEKIIQLIKLGYTYSEISEKLNISQPTICKYKKIYLLEKARNNL